MLKRLNELINEQGDNVNEKNYCSIIIFLKKNKFDSNKFKIDEIIKENDEKNRNLLDNIDFFHSGYAVKLFSIVNNTELFCLKENKINECIICWYKKMKKLMNFNLLFISIILT